MTRRATFTAAELRRALRVARETDAQAVVEVTADGKIRILPAGPESRGTSSDVDRWFDQNDTAARH